MNVALLKDTFSALTKFIYFDPSQSLREKTISPEKFQQFIDEAKELSKGSNTDDRYFLYGMIGNLLRIMEKPEEAMYYLTWCLEHAVNESNSTREIVSSIRLGEAYKYNNQHERAFNCFDKALYLCEINQIHDYEDFALQHKGKCLMELERFSEAKDCFGRALDIRKKKGNQTLIDSTQQAIVLVKKLHN